MSGFEFGEQCPKVYTSLVCRITILIYTTWQRIVIVQVLAETFSVDTITTWLLCSCLSEARLLELFSMSLLWREVSLTAHEGSWGRLPEAVEEFAVVDCVRIFPARVASTNILDILFDTETNFQSIWVRQWIVMKYALQLEIEMEGTWQDKEMPSNYDIRFHEGQVRVEHRCRRMRRWRWRTSRSRSAICWLDSEISSFESLVRRRCILETKSTRIHSSTSLW